MSATDEHLCARCARHTVTCCQETDIYVTAGDVRRITEQTGSDDFYEWRAPEDAVYFQQHDDPLWMERVFQPDGTRRVLKQKPGGDCTFLGTAGCILPLETRPLICRLYPYDYNEQGIFSTLARGCPTELLQPGQDLLLVLDIPRPNANRWHEQLYAELRQEPAGGEEVTSRK